MAADSQKKVPNSSQPDLVLLGGVEYEVSECDRCRGAGSYFDATLADNYAGNRGIVHCITCSGYGRRYRITHRGIQQERDRRGA